MRCGTVQADDPSPMTKEDRFKRWLFDTLPNISNVDALWGFAIRAQQEMTVVSEEDVDDPVVLRLLRMGIFDWKDPDVYTDAEVNAGRYMASLGLRLLKRILALEKKVRRHRAFLLMKDTDDFVVGCG